MAWPLAEELFLRLPLVHLRVEPVSGQGQAAQAARTKQRKPSQPRGKLYDIMVLKLDGNSDHVSHV